MAPVSRSTYPDVGGPVRVLLARTAAVDATLAEPGLSEFARTVYACEFVVPINAYEAPAIEAAWDCYRSGPHEPLALLDPADDLDVVCTHGVVAPFSLGAVAMTPPELDRYFEQPPYAYTNWTGPALPDVTMITDYRLAVEILDRLCPDPRAHRLFDSLLDEWTLTVGELVETARTLGVPAREVRVSPIAEPWPT